MADTPATDGSAHTQAEPRRCIRADRPAVVVVGAGISGLTCLWQLRRAGVDAVCLEASSRAGGALASRRAEGFVVETGASTVLETAEMVRLADEAGLASDILRSEPGLPRFILRGGALHPLPRNPLDLATSALISLPAKMRLLAELWAPRRVDSKDESVASFVGRRFGPEIVDAFVAPFVAGTFGGVPERLSARSVLPSLVELEDRFGGVIKGLVRSAGTRGERATRTMMSFTDGLESLPQRMARELGERVRFGTTVDAISPTSSQSDPWSVGARHGNEKIILGARAVILAVPAPVAAGLLGAIAPAASSAIASIECASLTTVTLEAPRARVRHALRGVGFLVCPGERARMLGCLWPSSIFAGRAPAGSVTFTLFFGGSRDPEAASFDDSRLAEIAVADVSTLLGIDGPATVTAIGRHAFALPQYAPGHDERMKDALAAVGRVPRLFVTGNYIRGMSVGECVRHAEAVAAKAIEALN